MTTIADIEALGIELPKTKEWTPIPHLVIEDDNWYSCPVSGRCIRDDGDNRCNCGADSRNAQVTAMRDELLAVIERLAEEVERLEDENRSLAKAVYQ